MLMVMILTAKLKAIIIVNIFKYLFGGY